MELLVFNMHAESVTKMTLVAFPMGGLRAQGTGLATFALGAGTLRSELRWRRPRACCLCFDKMSRAEPAQLLG